ncbi:reprolysin-like metallopeptidase [Pseudomonas sp. TWP3-2]|uniref:reprolysin-like metallopeptidase n=1 Tax=Pseudomonas sp. TWP3-2 TaxID=2804574 RepID=UPI003CE8952A
MANQPLTLNVFMHEDLSNYSRQKLYETHFSWFADEIQNCSNRKLTVNMFTPSEAKALSDCDYKNISSTVTLAAWKEKLNNHFGPQLLHDSHTRFNKYLLLTRNNINQSILGIAQFKGYAGIASITSDMTPAHEAGHMFGATHADSEVLYNGWWSETVMTAESSPLRGNANRFSDKNRQNIRNYLNGPIIRTSTPRPDDDDD